MAAVVSHHHYLFSTITRFNSPRTTRRESLSRGSVRCADVSTSTSTSENRRVTVSNGNDSLDICRVLNGMWQTSGGWGRIDRDDAVEAMLRYADSGLSTFDMADHYGPAEDLYGIFINRVRRERPPEFLEQVKGLTKWVPPPVKMTRSFVRDSIDVSRKRMDVDSLDMLQFHWYGTVMGGLLSEKFLDTNIAIPFSGPAINTPSLQKYKRMVDAWGGWSLFQGLLRTLKQVATKHGVSISTVAVKYILDQPAVAGSMVGVRLGLSEHIQDCNAIFSLVLDEDDVNSIREASAKGKDLLKVIGDCGDEYRRA
ncbi:NADP-dependent oxidoreductase domain [Sesbania bispinosa]|nr:NADP-dependent oxidoreductase domain [Sesbania bispinosa]